jgi:hypothetical protein
MSSPYVNALAATASELFAEGINDPSVGEILKRYFGADKVLPRSLVTKSQVAAMRSVLAKDGHITCPLTETYYRRFRKPGALKTSADAMRCLPVGAGKVIYGMRRLAGSADEDRIWLLWQQHRTNATSAGHLKVMVEVDAALDAGDITAEQKEFVFEPARRLQEAAPSMKALPAFPMKALSN